MCRTTIGPSKEDAIADYKEHKERTVGQKLAEISKNAVLAITADGHTEVVKRALKLAQDAAEEGKSRLVFKHPYLGIPQVVTQSVNALQAKDITVIILYSSEEQTYHLELRW